MLGSWHVGLICSLSKGRFTPCQHMNHTSMHYEFLCDSDRMQNVLHLWSAVGVNRKVMTPQMQIANAVFLPAPDHMVPAIWLQCNLKSSACPTFGTMKCDFSPFRVGSYFAYTWIAQEQAVHSCVIHMWFCAVRFHLILNELKSHHTAPKVVHALLFKPHCNQIFCTMWSVAGRCGKMQCACNLHLGCP